jgi:hypothetical protein
METLQREDPPGELWPTLVRRIHFTPQQQQQLATAWELYSQQKGILLQRQAGVVQRLQLLLSAQGEDASVPSEQKSGIASDGSRLPSVSSSGNSDVQGLNAGPALLPLEAAGPALLPLEAAEEADKLLSEVLRIMQLLTQQQRRMVTFYINALTAEQHTNLVLNAYPFFLSAPKGKAASTVFACFFGV